MRGVTLLLAGVLALLGAAGEADAAKKQPKKRVKPITTLVYTATYGYRHDSIAAGRKQFEALGARRRFEVRFTEDPSDLNRKTLKRFDVLVFLNSTGNQPWSDSQRQAMLDWLAKGGGVISVHSAVDSGYDWSDFGDISGAYFMAHPHTGTAGNVVEDRTSPLTRHLPERIELDEEYYRFQLDPRPNVHVLASLDTTSFDNGGVYAERQPVAWCQEIGGGRAFTTAWGHFDETFADAGIWKMMVQAVRWTGGRIEADCRPTVPRPRVLQAEDADVIGAAEKRSSPFDGANQVVSHIQNDGYLLFRDVDLTGVRALTLLASPETVPAASPYTLPQPTPALGGKATVVLDAMPYDGQALGGSPPELEAIGSAELAPGGVPSTALDGAVGSDGADWTRLEIPIERQSGKHDVYLVFTNETVAQFNPARIFAPAVQEGMYLMSVDWMELG
jgi:type 1 glutamine amidotransferase